MVRKTSHTLLNNFILHLEFLHNILIYPYILRVIYKSIAMKYRININWYTIYAIITIVGSGNLSTA